jgi:hypothetical protein
MEQVIHDLPFSKSDNPSCGAERAGLSALMPDGLVPGASSELGNVTKLTRHGQPLVQLGLNKIPTIRT